MRYPMEPEDDEIVEYGFEPHPLPNYEHYNGDTGAFTHDAYKQLVQMRKDACDLGAAAEFLLEFMRELDGTNTPEQIHGVLMGMLRNGSMFPDQVDKIARLSSDIQEVATKLVDIKNKAPTFKQNQYR